MTTRSGTPLPIPHKDRLTLKIVRGVWRQVRDTPRTPREARTRINTWFDKRVIGRKERREQLVRRWSRGAALVNRIPGGHRLVQPMSMSLGRRLTAKGHTKAARTVLRAAERTTTAGTANAQLAARARVLDLTSNHPGANDVLDLIRASLEQADTALAGGDHNLAGSHLQDAFDVAFHRTFHFEDTASPYAADPDAFLAPFRASTAFQRVTSPATRARVEPPTEPTQVEGRPRRVLFATATNFNFARDIIDEYSQRDDVEVREVDVRRLGGGTWKPNPLDLVRNRLRLADGIPMEVPAELRADFDWADTVFVEWGHRAMTWVSMLPDLRARVIARLHSYEALTQFPLITNWAGIDDLVFVSGHIRNLVEHSCPGVLDGPRRHTIGNRNVLADYDLPKRPGAAHTLGLIGWGQVVKDPMWALDVLEELRRDDPRWRIRLLGNGFADDTSLTKAAADYRDKLEARFEALGDAVLRPGYSKDVPHALRRVGVILSTSQREGTHEGLIQGAASGAFPVVRNWPVVSRWGGAHTMFPREWVVETPVEAADRIRKMVAADGSDLQNATAETKAWTVEHYDWSVVGPQLEALILSTEGPTT